MMTFPDRGFGVMFLGAALASASLFGQQPNGPIPWQGTQAVAAAPAAPMLSMEQLTSLVAPMALYPDPLLAQVLAASTYPLEIVEAEQWLQQNRNLSGPQLVQAARQQNWDASVQALTVFPDAMALLSRDIRWTTDLGNAFLSQQQDVMNAIQMLRAQARGNGQLVSGPQQVVTTQAQNGQSAIEIEPANPQVMYVPMYAPQAVWGPGMAAAYGGPGYQEGWSNFAGIGGSAIQFGAGVLMRTMFSGALGSGLGLGDWGWALNWLSHALFLNPSFFHNNGYGGYGGGYGGYGGYASVAWVHNPMHRLGVRYGNPMVAARFDSGYGRYGYRSQAAGYGSHYGRANYSYAPRPAASEYRSAAPSYRSYGSFAPQRNSERFSQPFSQPRESRQYYANSSRGNGGGHYSAPKMPHYSAPKAPHYSAPKSSHFWGGHGGGGHSGKSKHH